MPRLFVILAAAMVVYILFRRVATLPPHRRRAEYLKLGAGVAVVAVILLTLAGKMHWVGAALTGLLVALRQGLPVILRYFPMLASLRSRQASGSQQSSLSTALLRMRLDHETGALSGEVLQGPLKGWRLDDLTREQLNELSDYCRDNDGESLRLLEGYLEQRFGEQAGSGHSQAGEGSNSESLDGSMSRREALEILGLKDSADEEAVIAAHRKLMQKLHPDRGGSDYLAAKINQAKDLLLQS